MLRVGVIGLIKGSIVDSEGIVAIEWLHRELFVAKKDGFDDKSGVKELIKGSILVFESIVEHKSLSRLVTSVKTSDLVVATSISGMITSTSSSLKMSMAVCSWSAKAAFSSMRLHVPGSSSASTASHAPVKVALGKNCCKI